MVKEVADVTIKIKSLEETDFDVITEFLQDNKYEYEVVEVGNEQIIDTRSEQDKWFDYEMQRGFDKARGEV